MYKVIFNYEEKDFNSLTLDSVLPHNSLLEVALEVHIDLDYDCGGNCACSSCHIYVVEGDEYLEPLTPEEIYFLERVEALGSTSRLACQCILLEGAGNIVVKVPIKKSY